MLEFNFEPFPELHTEKLVLRAVAIEDADALFALRSNPDAMKYIGRTLPKDIEEVHGLIKKMTELTERIQWAITLKDDSKLIGTIGYHIIQKEHYRAEIGYMLHPDFWRRGLMSEAIASVVTYGFDGIGLHSIEARITPTNGASAAVLVKNKFVREAYLTESFFFNGEFYDTEIYSLLKNPVRTDKPSFYVRA